MFFSKIQKMKDVLKKPRNWPISNTAFIHHNLKFQTPTAWRLKLV